MRSVVTTLTLGSACILNAADSYNVLFIYTDEHNFRTLESYLPHIDPSQRHPWGDNVPLETPNLNYIAENGALMTNCYVTSPLSTPSRASLMTGKYPQKTNCIGNDLILDQSLKTLPALFKENGYATGYVGKWHLSGKAKPGFNPDPDYGWHENDYMFNRGHFKSIKDGEGGSVAEVIEEKPYVRDGYSYMTDYLTDKAIDFMERHKKEPFVCFVSIPDPHGPNEVSEKYRKMYSGFHFENPATAVKETTELPSWGMPREKFTQKDLQNYWGMVKCIDDNVGRMIDWLKSNDQLDKTIIVFTSDHGDMCGEHGRFNKNVPFDAALKVPCLIYAPRIIKPGTVVHNPVSNIDIYPTLANICQINTMPEVDGTDLTDLLKGGTLRKKREYVFSRSGNNKGWISVTSERYKLIHSVEVNDKPWLIDRKADPKEMVNFYNDPAYATIRKELTEALVDYCRTHNEPKYENQKLRKELSL